MITLMNSLAVLLGLALLFAFVFSAFLCFLETIGVALNVDDFGVMDQNAESLSRAARSPSS